jgi:hypothetical protein
MMENGRPTSQVRDGAQKFCFRIFLWNSANRNLGLKPLIKEKTLLITQKNEERY